MDILANLQQQMQQQEQEMAQHQMMLVQQQMMLANQHRKNDGVPNPVSERDYTETEWYIEKVRADIARAIEEGERETAQIEKRMKEVDEKIRRSHDEFEKRFHEMWNR